MAYAAFVNVQNRIARFPIDASTRVSPEMVDEFLDDVSSEVDARLVALGQTVPIVTPAWFLTRLRSLVADGAAAITLKAMFPDARGPGETAAYEFYDARYRRGFADLETLVTVLGSSSTVSAMSTYFTENEGGHDHLGRLIPTVSTFDVTKEY